MSSRPNERLAQLASAHWREAYRALIRSVGGEWREFGRVAAFVSRRAPVAFANGCLVLERVARDDLARAAAWVDAADLPYRIRIETELETDELAGVALDLGLQRDEWAMPGMVLEPVPPAPEPAAGIRVERVTSANHGDFIGLLVDAGLPHAVALIAFSAASVDDPDLAMFVAYLDDGLAGTAVAVRTGPTAGVYTVGTVEAARRRGVGRTATWAAVEQGRRWGCSAVVLQASRMGAPVYERMGFRTVVRYAVFTANRP